MTAVSIPFGDRVTALLQERRKFLELAATAQQAQQGSDPEAIQAAEHAVLGFIFAPLGIAEFSEVTLQQLSSDALIERLMYLNGPLQVIVEQMFADTETTDTLTQPTALNNRGKHA